MAYRSGNAQVTDQQFDQLENSYIKRWHKAALDCAGDIRRFTDIGVSY